MHHRPSTENSLWCGACKAMHPKSAFGKDKNTFHGLTHACKAVVAERNRRAHQKCREANNTRHAALRRQRKASGDAVRWALKKLLNDARRRARDKGIEFSIVIDDLPMPELCPIFGVNLVYQADGRRLDNSASIDRIDSRLGYTPDNVWIISWRANQIKNDATPAEMRLVADAVEARLGPRRVPTASGLDGREHGWPEESDDA